MEQINLEDEHQTLHAIVDHLQGQKHLTEDDELKLKETKKRKLWVKDRLMYQGRWV